MRVVVTGRAGFLGSHDVERLQAAGHDALVPGRREPDRRVEAVVVRLVENAAGQLFGLRVMTTVRGGLTRTIECSSTLR